MRNGSHTGYDIALVSTDPDATVGQIIERYASIATQTLAICWYATVGHHADDVRSVRRLAPWYRTKYQPSVADMVAKLRRVIIASQFHADHPQLATDEEINLLRLAWEDAAA